MTERRPRRLSTRRPKRPKVRLPEIPPDLPRFFRVDPVELARRMEEREREDEEQRTLTGKYAPHPGTCYVCEGLVIADIRFHPSDVLGSPPQQAHVSGWHCDNCGIEYRFRPPKRIVTPGEP